MTCTDLSGDKKVSLVSRMAEFIITRVRIWKVLVLFSAILLVISAYLYFFNKDISYRTTSPVYRPLKTLIRDQSVVRKRVLDKQKEKKTGTPERGEDIESLLLIAQNKFERECASFERKLDDYNDLIDGSSEYYIKPLKAVEVTTMLLNDYAYIIHNNHAELDKVNSSFLAPGNDLSLSGYKKLLDVYEGILTGCSANERLGVITLTLMEELKRRGVSPNKSIHTLSLWSRQYLSFGTFNAQMLAIAVLSNMNVGSLLSPLEVYDLEELSYRTADIIKRYRSELKRAKTVAEIQEVLQYNEVEKEILKEYISEFIENLNKKYTYDD